MTTVDAPALSLAEVSTILGFFIVLLGGLVWIIKAVNAMNRQVHNNGGASLRDAIDRIEQNQLEIRRDVQQVHGRVTKHMEWHLSHTEGEARTRRGDGGNSE